ncbi:hypothetical protein UPYG_G00182970 [Umbra pygmaea]|uniref:SH2 domain-containing protein n=1 Tax=Umbra pygmaea TaxID=75934 RepID=A0ABD0WSH9_UMBPY
MTMSFFGKFKNIGPPAPPKRIENNAGWPEDEFEEDDGDTYEAPPCERPVIKVPARPVEEDVYLGRKTERSNPVIPKRQAAPPPRPAKTTPMGKPPPPHQQADYSEDFYIDPNTNKPPEIDRKEKPGKWAIASKLALPSRPSPALALPPPPAEEDVYLDPNEGQEDSDDLYLEPAAAYPPPPRSPMRMPLPPKTAVSPVHLAIKPPVPRAKSTSVLISQTMTASSPDVRRSTFPGKLPPPTLVMKLPLPISQKEPKPSPPHPPSVDTIAVSQSGVKNIMPMLSEEKEWFVGDCDRKAAEELLHRINKDGAFLIRNSSAQNARQPYTLAVLYRQKVYNIPIRFLEDTSRYALGKEGKTNEEFFSNLQEIISHHKKNQLLLIDSKSHAKDTTYLTHPAHR